MKFLSSFVISFSVFSLTFAVIQDDDDPFKKLHDECQVDIATRVEKENIDRINKGEGTDSDRAIVGRHALCVNIKTGIQNADGDIDINELKKLLKTFIGDQTKINDILSTCTKGDKKIASAAAFFLNKCIYNKLGIISSSLCLKHFKS